MTLLDPCRRALGALALLLLAGLPLGCGRAVPGEEKTPPATVKWETASTNALEEWTELAGATIPLPDRYARISAAVEGKVRTVLTGADSKPVAEGQRVEKGTIVVQLDDTIMRANLAKIEANQDVLQQEQLQAQIAFEQASSEMDRLLKLKEKDDKEPKGQGYVPLVRPIDLEKATFALRDAQAKLSGAKSKITMGEKDIAATREQLKFYSLTAPITGQLGRIQVGPGQNLSVGATVAEMVNLDDEIDVLCFVPPSLIRKLKLDMDARSGPVEKDPKQTEPEAAGKVLYIADQAEPETGNFAVKVRFANKEAHLRSNRVLRIRVLTQPARECLALPESAVMEDEDPPTVVIVENVKTGTNADGKEETTGVARRVQVELGLRDRVLHQVEILRLIDPEKDPEKKWKGDIKEALFVVEGGQGLQTGDAVKLDTGED
jgi:membrane fusion protein (multidrug efflux system)